jgi:hypothetical protein
MPLSIEGTTPSPPVLAREFEDHLVLKSHNVCSEFLIGILKRKQKTGRDSEIAAEPPSICKFLNRDQSTLRQE